MTKLATASLRYLSILAVCSECARAQSFDASNGLGAQSGAFSSSELQYLKSMCMNMYSEFLSIDKQRASASSSSTSVGGTYGPQGVGINAATSNSQANSSRDAKVSSSQGMTNCDGIVGPYFRYKEAQLQAEAMKTVGLANADAIKSVGTANANSNTTVGLANADALKSVGISNSKSQLYTGLAGAGGSVLASLFTSGNQKAAVKAQAQAEVEKARIIADLELQKARLQYELARAQSGFQSRPQEYQQPSYPSPQSYDPTIAAAVPSPVTGSYMLQPNSLQQAPVYSSQPYQQGQLAATYSNPVQQANAFYSASQVARSSTNALPSQRQPQNPANIAQILASLALVQDPNCNPGGIVVLTRNGARICAFPKSTLPPGQYLYDNGRLQKY